MTWDEVLVRIAACAGTSSERSIEAAERAAACYQRHEIPPPSEIDTVKDGSIVFVWGDMASVIVRPWGKDRPSLMFLDVEQSAVAAYDFVDVLKRLELQRIYATQKAEGRED